jgi:hypothetical protein
MSIMHVRSSLPRNDGRRARIIKSVAEFSISEGERSAAAAATGASCGGSCLLPTLSSSMFHSNMHSA